MPRLAKRYVQSRLIDTREAASQAGVSMKTIRRWIKEGDIVAFQFGMPQYRIAQISLEEYLQKLAHSPEKEQAD